jgi:hypothetical protein
MQPQHCILGECGDSTAASRQTTLSLEVSAW